MRMRMPEWLMSASLPHRRVSSEGDAALSVNWRGPNGSQIAVGLAQGGVHVFNVQESSSGDVSLTNPTSVGAQKSAANAVKYSPGGALLAVGLASGDIEVYDAKKAYQLRGCCRGHT
jgi:WD40 repeat protein